MNKISTYLLAILSAACFVLWISYSHAQNERERMAANQSSLLSYIDYYKTKDSLSAASVLRLELDKKELEEYRSGLVAEIENLNIKLRRVQSASTTGTQTTVPITAHVRDSIIYRDGIRDTVPCISFVDPWVTLQGCSVAGQFEGLIISKDTLVQIVHRVPKEWWFIKYGTKGIRQEITSKNPHTVITYTEYIELKKKGR